MLQHTHVRHRLHSAHAHLGADAEQGQTALAGKPLANPEPSTLTPSSSEELAEDPHEEADERKGQDDADRGPSPPQLIPPGRARRGRVGPAVNVLAVGGVHEG